MSKKKKEVAPVELTEQQQKELEEIEKKQRESMALKLRIEEDENYVPGTNLLGYSKTFGSVDKDCYKKLLVQVGMTNANLTKDNMVDALNATTPLLVAIAPRDELEGMLAVQMVGIHNLAMEMMGRTVNTDQTVNGVSNNVNQVAKLTRTFIAQMDALNKHRGKGQQKMTVEHVHVNEGGQAVIGNIDKGGGTNEK